MPPPPELITTAEACDLLKVVRSTLIRQVHAGRVAYSVRLSNGAYLFDRAVVEAKAKERGAAA